MQVTIGVWSPTLLEVNLHIVPTSLLVSMDSVASEQSYSPTSPTPISPTVLIMPTKNQIVSIFAYPNAFVDTN